ncbi:MAG: hypothetical protein ACPGVX_09970 [Thalassobaculaceae bacterium]
MPTFDDMYRKTMAILSESVSDVLGPTDAVAQEVHRAAGSADENDFRAAEAAFDALPSDQRTDINDRASMRAQEVFANANDDDDKELPPTFLRPGDHGEDAGSIAE